MDDDDVIVSASLGTGGLYKAEELLKESDHAATDSAKIAKLTLAVKVLVAHLSYEKNEREMDDMNRRIGNF